MKENTIKVKLLDPDASLPKRNNPSDAGADLRSLLTILVPPLGRELIKTGLSIEIPEGFYGRIAPRSGLALRYGIDILAGVVDSSYRGEICVVVHNTDHQESFVINKGDRIAQLIIEKHYNLIFEQINSLSESDRSINGFGSSGLK